MTREDENRLIALWLGWTIRRHGEYVNLSGPDGTLLLTAWGPNEVADESINEKLPDFRTSEEANALILDKFSHPMLHRSYDSPGWYCTPNKYKFPTVEELDRKSAIVEAALKLIAAGKAGETK